MRRFLGRLRPSAIAGSPLARVDALRRGLRTTSGTGSGGGRERKNADARGVPTSSSSTASPLSGASFASEAASSGEASHRDPVDTTPAHGPSEATLQGNQAPGVAVSRRVGGAGPSTANSAAAGTPRGSVFVRAPSGSKRGEESVETGSGGEAGRQLKRIGDEETAVRRTKARPEDGPVVPDYGPLRATGLWSVEDVVDEGRQTVDFRRIDNVESELLDELKETEEALIPYDEEERWKHKLMFVHKFKKTPKHLTWKELGEEIECMDCSIDLDEHRPEEVFTIKFFFTDKKTGTRDLVWEARNDVAYSEGFTDLLAAVGACLGRSDVHRTIRFDDGQGVLRDFTVRKRSRYTSDVTLSFRPPEKYSKFQRKEEMDEYEAAMEAEGMSTWGFHPALMDPEYSELDFQDPEGTYMVAMSAHGFCFILLKAVNRLLARPMKDFYRPSQLMRTAKVRTEDSVGISHAMKGWLGIDEQIYPHYTPIEAIQEHWLGQDAPFTLVAIVNKLREMGYLKKENPEFQSWLSVRNHDTHLAIRNMGVKLLGVGASTLFLPVQHNSTVNRLLPKHQQRRLESRFSLNAVMGLPDETRRIDDFKRITEHARLSGVSVDKETPTPGEAMATEAEAGGASPSSPGTPTSGGTPL